VLINNYILFMNLGMDHTVWCKGDENFSGLNRVKRLYYPLKIIYFIFYSNFITVVQPISSQKSSLHENFMDDINIIIYNKYYNIVFFRDIIILFHKIYNFAKYLQPVVIYFAKLLCEKFLLNCFFIFLCILMMVINRN
jgi:hypothetical protein